MHAAERQSWRQNVTFNSTLLTEGLCDWVELPTIDKFNVDDFKTVLSGTSAAGVTAASDGSGPLITPSNFSKLQNDSKYYLTGKLSGLGRQVIFDAVV